MQKPLSALIATEDDAWSLVQSWIAHARNHVELLPAERARSERVLLALQVTTRSPLGTIALRAGGILIDHGWMRVLGAGHPQLAGDLARWNHLGDDAPAAASPGYVPAPAPQGYMIVAYDVIGGIFAVDNGALGGKGGTVFYFGPDTLEWEDLGKTYSEFLQWAMNADLSEFYRNTRWPGWQEEVKRLAGDTGFSLTPPLWTEADDPRPRSREPAPMPELWARSLDMSKQRAPRKS